MKISGFYQQASCLLAALIITILPVNSHAAEKKTDNFSFGLYDRHYDYYIPDNVDANAPLLLVFHGLTGDSERLWADPNNALDLPKLADEKRFIVMWMGSTKIAIPKFGQSWNAGVCCSIAVTLNVDDVGYTLKAIERIKSRLPTNVTIDDSRVYAIGHSNGAAMVNRLALQKSDVFTAVVPVSFPLVNNHSWRIPASWIQHRNVPVLAMHGTKDLIVPYYNRRLLTGLPIPTLSPLSPYFLDTAQESLQTWATRNKCIGQPLTTETHTSIGKYQTQIYSACGGSATVGLHTFYGGGGITGHRPEYPKDNGGMDVIRESWRFLSQYQK